jgi:hypothetical protein
MASLTSAHRGNFNRGYAFAGSNVWRTDKIIPVKELINTLKMEYAAHKLKTQFQSAAFHQNAEIIKERLSA